MYRFRGLGAAITPAVQSALQGAAASSGVPLSLLTSVARAESSFNPAAVSSAGAQGLLQLMPATGASLGVTNPFDPVQNADAGARYLAQLYSQYGDWNTALIAYNEGPGALASKGPYASSQSYAAGILADAGISPDTALAAGAPADTTSVDASGLPVDLSAAGLSTGAWVGLGIAGLAVLWWVSS